MNSKIHSNMKGSRQIMQHSFLLDHQTGLLPLVNDWSEVELKNNVLALAKLAKICKMPVVLTTSYEEGPNGPIAPGLKRNVSRCQHNKKTR